ncbi:MAG: hypothetical protein HYV26_13160 [Candidatus Hydrogenedentes bacterium]|nr:hypothetical protein [Candidatus Hydrogenedentota bacterium]
MKSAWQEILRPRLDGPFYQIIADAPAGPKRDVMRPGKLDVVGARIRVGKRLQAIAAFFRGVACGKFDDPEPGAFDERGGDADVEQGRRRTQNNCI